MIGNFHYLASYTAAIAAGFSIADGQAIARAARYVDDCADFTIPIESAPEAAHAVAESLRIWPVFHYLPGNSEEIASQVNPAVGGLGTPEVLYALPLVCRPGGRLSRLIVQRARAFWNKSGPRDAKLQAIGIALHTLTDTFLHQGFAGIPAPLVNGAKPILAAKKLPRDQFCACMTEALKSCVETAFQLEPYQSGEAPSGDLGCEQLSGLPDHPGAVFQYQSPWAAVPAISCVNPLRLANAYRCLRSVLRYIRGAEPDFSTEETRDPQALLELGCYFASAWNDNLLPDTWFQQFQWLPRPQKYSAPTFEAEEPYLRSFKLRAMAQRDLVWDACPLIKDCAENFSAAAPENA